MSNNRGGFFSLNRFLGRKQKTDKNSSLDGFSKSSAHTLTRSTTNLEDIAPQNKITPITTVQNAPLPFEQTFRITVYLPMNQLYVSRIGAKTKLYELLNIICINKLLDSNKFEFRHPADDNQIFDLNFTIGEVGLSEIKLAHKNGKDDIVRYRINNSGHENRLRPHTMSTISTYSSTNSLNSSDSLGIIVNHRLNNGHAPAVQGRKKRIAPRPPSQNSTTENSERKEIMERSSSHIDQTVVDRTSLNRQHFHVSSPNLSMNNNATSKSYSSIDASISNNLEDKQNNYIIKNNKTTSSNRPLSVQPRSPTIETNEPKYGQLKSKTGNHSRTSSESSDIIRESYPEPQPRKRSPSIDAVQIVDNKNGKIQKLTKKCKKAPAPPPRSVSNYHGPVATPRCLQKLSEEEMKDENGNIESVDLENVRKAESKSMAEEPIKDQINKDEKNIKMINHIQSMDNCAVTSVCNENPSNSEIQEKRTTIEIIVEGKAKPKKLSVVNFSLSCIQPEIDPSDISKQVNDIIDEAVKINEAKLNAKNERKNEEDSTKTDKMNNNNGSTIAHTTSEKENLSSSQPKIYPNTNSYPENDRGLDKRNISSEIPIQPILNEVCTFDFQEYSDNSLPTSSTTSTLNATEIASAGPDSLITSDIEDGYKGNDVEKNRKTETTYDDSKEDFIESQFGFLSEHLDGKTNVDDSDDEKTVGSIKTANIVSSTMINDKFGETFKVSTTVEKRDVIDELTQIINCNRLETFVKPTNDTNQSNQFIDVFKRSSLTNFHIGVYSNSINENNRTEQTNFDSSTKKDPIIEKYILKSDENTSKTSENHAENKSETFVIPKPVGRSMSFHSTFAEIIDRENSQTTTNKNIDLTEASRSFSYISLNSIPKQENNNHQTTTAIKNELNESTRKKSSSELSIADTPSLQSIEVMKSILNKSRSMNSECLSDTDVKITDQDNQRNFHEREDKLHNTSMTSSKTRNEPKTWKYQGPPSINVSTWGERPKSLVHIKSDNDYIFGGSSKMSLLQKRFSGLNEQENHTPGKLFQTQNEHCDNSSCKLPVVRSVEYKKNISSTSEDTQDSIQRPIRSSYEISRIISQKPSTGKKRTPYATTTLNRIKNSNFTSENSMLKSAIVNEPEKLFSEQSDTLDNKDEMNDMQRFKDMNSTANEKPMFSQFTLRKTGLKEKFIDESNRNNRNDVTKSSVKNNDCLKPTEPKASVIPTAPKPPPMPKKFAKRPSPIGSSMNSDESLDVRSELFEAIRNFNRDALKRNCIY